MVSSLGTDTDAGVTVEDFSLWLFGIKLEITTSQNEVALYFKGTIVVSIGQINRRK